MKPVFFALALLFGASTFAQSPFPNALDSPATLGVGADGVSSALTSRMLIGDLTAQVANAVNIPQWSLVTFGSELTQVCLISGNTLTFGTASAGCPSIAGRGLAGTTIAAHAPGVVGYLNVNALYHASVSSAIMAIESRPAGAYYAPPGTDLVKAVAAVPAGGQMIIPSGSYSLSAPMTPAAGVTISCQPGSVLTTTGSFNAHFLINQSHTTIDGCNLYGTPASGGVGGVSGGIYIAPGVDSPHITNLFCQNVGNINGNTTTFGSCIKPDGASGVVTTNILIQNVVIINPSNGIEGTTAGSWTGLVDNIRCIGGPGTQANAGDCVHFFDEDAMALAAHQTIQNIYCRDNHRICFEFQGNQFAEAPIVSNITTELPNIAEAGSIGISFSFGNVGSNLNLHGVLAHNIQVFDPQGILGEPIEFLVDYGKIDGVTVIEGNTSRVGSSIATGGQNVQVSHAYLYGGLSGIHDASGQLPNNGLQVHDITLEEQCGPAISVNGGGGSGPLSTTSGDNFSHITISKTPGSCPSDANLNWVAVQLGGGDPAYQTVGETFRDMSILIKPGTATGFKAFVMGLYGPMPAGTLFDHISITDQNSPSISQAYYFNSPGIPNTSTISNNTFVNMSSILSNEGMTMHYYNNHSHVSPGGSGTPAASYIVTPATYAVLQPAAGIMYPGQANTCSDCLINAAGIVYGGGGTVSQQVTTNGTNLTGTPIIPAVTGCTVGAAAGAAGTCTMGGSSTATRMFFQIQTGPSPGGNATLATANFPAGPFPNGAVCTYSVSTVSPAADIGGLVVTGTPTSAFLYEIDTLPASTSIGIGVLCQ